MGTCMPVVLGLFGLSERPMLIQAGTASSSSLPFFGDRRGSWPRSPLAQTHYPSSSVTTRQRREPFIARRSGLVDGSFRVFVDLAAQTPREIGSARWFGPHDRSGPTTPGASSQPSITAPA